MKFHTPVKFLLLPLIILLAGTTLPLWAEPDGLYLFSYTKTSNFPELEAQYLSMGLDIRQNSIETYKGIVLEMEDGCYLYPVEMLAFRISSKGEVSCPANPTVTGLYNNRSGEFHWEGYIGFHDQLKYSRSTGALEKIKNDNQVRLKNSTMYLLKDDQGNQLTASLQEGFIILKNEKDEKSAYQGWPILVGPDGTFTSYFDLSTEVITGRTGAPPQVQAFHNAIISTEGFITEDGGINISFFNDYAMNRDQQEKPGESFSGRVLNTQEISSHGENNYNDFKVHLRSRIDHFGSVSTYPSWFLNPPRKENQIVGTGFRTLPDKEKALQIAETIAAAVLANQIQVRIQVESINSDENGTSMVQQHIKETSRAELDYTVKESLYDEATQMPFVLLALNTGITHKR